MEAVRGFGVRYVTGDLTLLLLDAYTEESLESGEGGAIYPVNSSDIYLTLMFKLDGPPKGNSLEWLGRNGRLVSAGQEYSAERAVYQVIEGILIAEGLIYAIPRDSEYGIYRLEMPDGQGIDLSPFFD
jgi:hypothetical protein